MENRIKLFLLLTILVLKLNAQKLEVLDSLQLVSNHKGLNSEFLCLKSVTESIPDSTKCVLYLLITDSMRYRDKQPIKYSIFTMLNAQKNTCNYKSLKINFEHFYIRIKYPVGGDNDEYKHLHYSSELESVLASKHIDYGTGGKSLNVFGVIDSENIKVLSFPIYYKSIYICDFYFVL